jgi:rhodanese-related sulfurtransferase
MEGKVEWMKASEVRDKLKREKESFQLLDVREKNEVESKRIPGSYWIPLGELKRRINELDKNKELAIHCESGLRSYKACLKLQELGIENVKNVDGGMLCWYYDTESKDK